MASDRIHFGFVKMGANNVLHFRIISTLLYATIGTIYIEWFLAHKWQSATASRTFNSMTNDPATTVYSRIHSHNGPETYTCGRIGDLIFSTVRTRNRFFWCANNKNVYSNFLLHQFVKFLAFIVCSARDDKAWTTTTKTVTQHLH